jgi:amidophosphoribosyltransferase
MSDPLHHECGLALVRLRRPLDHYRQKHGDIGWGLRKLYLLMEKQHNRGQDGAGIATVKFDMPPGATFLERARSAKRNPVERLFDEALGPLAALSDAEHELLEEIELKRRIPFLGEVHLGHLRYGTFGGQTQDACHPFLRRSIVASRTLAVAGNFNMTNAPELFDKLVQYGLHPVGESDTQVVLERIGYSLDREHERLRASMGPQSFQQLEGRDLAEAVSAELSMARILRKASADWDGGYTLAGLLGNGDCFVCRDPAGIRPCFIHLDDEVAAMASERAALVTVFDVSPSTIRELEPGHALIVRRDGAVSIERFADPLPRRSCTFERIYFSRGNDREIYAERKALGRNLASRVLDAVGEELDRCVFSFIPNTAEAAYLGLTEEIERLMRERRADALWKRIAAGQARREDVDALARTHVRREKAAHKDQRLRTFITHDRKRRDLVSHVYDITPGVVGPEDTLVVVDDSIVRGTTLRESIITMLARLAPKRIIIASSAPPIAYPDCYGIDMSQLGRFIAFEAAVALLRDRGESELLHEVEARCRAQAEQPGVRLVNHVKAIYEPFSLAELEGKVAELVRSPGLAWPGRIDVIYQSVEGLRRAMPDSTGDWYFTGEYPTPGGYKVVNTAYLNWRARDDRRSYGVLTGPSARTAP